MENGNSHHPLPVPFERSWLFNRHQLKIRQRGQARIKFVPMNTREVLTIFPIVEHLAHAKLREE